MADSRNVRLLLSRLNPGQFGGGPENGQLSTFVPANMPVLQIPEEMYVPAAEASLDELGSPNPDRGISRPWPVATS